MKIKVQFDLWLMLLIQLGIDSLSLCHIQDNTYNHTDNRQTREACNRYILADSLNKKLLWGHGCRWCRRRLR